MNIDILSSALPTLTPKKGSPGLRFSRKNFLRCLLALVLPLALLAGVYQLRLEALAWHLWHTHFQQAPVASSLKLDGYQVIQDGISISGLTDDISGLTYNMETNTLFSVLNKEPVLVELSLDGKVLRKIRISGVDDMEGITHIKGSLYVIADERNSRLILIELKNGINTIDASKARQISLGIDDSGNKNFEGISWDQSENRLLVTKEKNPLRILAIEGFVNTQPTSIPDLHISQVIHSPSSIGKLRDFSSITFHDATGHYVLLSDESRMAVEYDQEGRPVSALALWKGFHGLKNNIPQAEGIAIGPDRRIYIVSEPNLFYVFKPVESSHSGSPL